MLHIPNDGLISRRIRVAIGPAILLALALSAMVVQCEARGEAAGAPNNNFFGDWKLSPSRSRIVDEMKVQDLSANRYAFDFGGATETISTNGRDQPAGFGTTLSVTPEASGSWRIVRKQNGRAVLSAIWTLSKDGRTLTDAFTSFPPRGSPSTTNSLYTRVAGGRGFAGTWYSTAPPMNAAIVLQFRPYGGDGISFRNPSQGQTLNVKLDGRDYPNAGVPGMTSSVRRIDVHALERTDRINGKIADTREIQLSPDLRTLTMAVYKEGQSHHSVLVFERQ